MFIALVPVKSAGSGGGLILFIPFMWIGFKYGFEISLYTHIIFFIINIMIYGSLLYLLSLVFDIDIGIEIPEMVINAIGVIFYIWAVFELTASGMDFFIALLLGIPWIILLLYAGSFLIMGYALYYILTWEYELFSYILEKFL